MSDTDKKLQGISRTDIILSHKFIELRMIIGIYIFFTILYISTDQYWKHHCARVLCVKNECVCIEK